MHQGQSYMPLPWSHNFGREKNVVHCRVFCFRVESGVQLYVERGSFAFVHPIEAIDRSPSPVSASYTSLIEVIPVVFLVKVGSVSLGHLNFPSNSGHAFSVVG